ncbi:MAG: hypothetical protein R3192_08605 [Woeseiaceae bacterium]|nr:hypothetical protein [Woeseiaceae bacterium]
MAAGRDHWGLSLRISALPGIVTSVSMLEDGSCATDHFIQPAYVLRRLATGKLLLCRIDCQGVTLPQLDPADSSQVLAKGWAACSDDSMTLYLPRDSIEMDIAWRIILRAYQHLASRPPTSRRRHVAATTLPQFAPTTRYWM